MGNKQKGQNKQILSDPVALYANLNPGTTDSQLRALTELKQAYDEKKRSLKEAQSLSRTISRRIGECKKNGEPVDALKSEMQAQSRILGELDASLAEVRNRILHHFGQATENAGDKRPEPSFGQRDYPAANAPAADVSISLADTLHGDWNQYVDSNPAASFYHRAEWRSVISRSFGHQGCYFEARGSNDDIVGILPLIHLNSRLFGNFLVSMPYCNYGGAVADHPSIEASLMAAANAHAAGLDAGHIEYRDNIAREGLPTRDEKVNMILPLPGSDEALWNGFTPKLRAQIRRPQKEGAEVQSGGSELLDDFYSVFARNMRDLGTPVYGRNFFSNILETFPDACRIMTVRLDNKPVAAGFLVRHRDTLEIPWASTVRDVNHLSINMLMYWEVLKYALQTGCRFFDFGRSSKNSGTFRFKQQWGARPMQLHWHYWLSGDNQLPAINPDNPKYALAINIWKRLPIGITRLIGPHIVKNIP